MSHSQVLPDRFTFLIERSAYCHLTLLPLQRHVDTLSESLEGASRDTGWYYSDRNLQRESRAVKNGKFLGISTKKAIIHAKDKRSGITYVYESKAYWDKEKKQSRAKRTLIGRLDEETGEIIPTDGRNRKDKIKEPKEPDYKALYEKLQKKCTSQEILIRSLKDEIRKLKEQ